MTDHQSSEEGAEGLSDRDVLALMRLLAPVVERRRHYGLKVEDAEVYARTILAAGYVLADRLAAVQSERDKARAFNERAEADKGRLWRQLRDRCESAEAERDAAQEAVAILSGVRDDLRARQLAVEALAGEWEREAAAMLRVLIPRDNEAAMLRECAEALRAVLASPSTHTQRDTETAAQALREAADALNALRMTTVNPVAFLRARADSLATREGS
jgi:hypothetical protein